MPVAMVSATAIHSAVSATHSSSAKMGTNASPTATSWVTVFTFAHPVAGTARPRRTQYERKSWITSSRTVMRMTGTTAKRSDMTSAHMAPSTSTLSASGSRNAPERVVPWRRASQPSMPSVMHSTIQRRVAA